MSRYVSLLAIMAVGGTALVGCPENKGDDKPAPTGATTTTTATPAVTTAAAPATAQTPAPTGNGTVSGVVTVTGKNVPTPQPIADAKGDPVCAKAAPKTNDVLADKKGDLQDVLVRIAPGSIKGKFPTPPDVAVDQQGCAYVPHTFGIQSGGTVVVKNEDKTTHNVHTYKGTESLFNQGQPPGTPDIRLPEKGKSFDEGVITFKCDIHKYMGSFGVVTDHPFFAVTGADGTFKLDKLPAGHYKVEAWHSVFGSKSQDVDVADGKPVTVNFSFNADTDKRAGD